MSGVEDLQAAIRHVTRCTGDPGAWRVGLSASDLTDLTMFPVDPTVAGVVVAKLRALHPTLFDPRTGAPVTPSAASQNSSPLDTPASDTPAPQAQVGETIDAIESAEHALANQNSATAQLDLHAITAILNAHSTSTEGGKTLARLQREIEAAVSARTDLDTPAGAKDFQRFLIGKLRDIRHVVETANLAGSSRAALLAACSALYSASANPPDSSAAQQSGADRAAPAGTPDDPLPPYGADELPPAVDDLGAGSDPFLDQLLADDRALLGAADPGQAVAPSQAPGPVPMLPSFPAFGGGPPPGPAGPSAVAPPAVPSGGPLTFPERSSPLPGEVDDSTLNSLIPLDELLPRDPAAEGELRGEPAEEPADQGHDASADDHSAALSTTPEAHLGAATVRLPDGEVVTAANPQLAAVISAAVGGTPVAEAFHQHGIAIPPAGSAVEHPVDPARLTPGDIGMFTDRHALVVGAHKAVFNGQIQPITSVTGPSFLGWEHPPAPGLTAVSPTPMPATTPAPTRPAATGTRS